MEALSPRGEAPHAAGGKADPSARTTPTPAPSSASTPEIATPELLAFVAEPHAIANYQPSTGIGLFDAEYDVANRQLVVTVRCAFRFQSGSQRRFPEADAADLAWDDASRAEWKKGYIETVSNKWSTQHSFRCSQPGLQTLAASVRVEVLEAEKDWHFRLDVTRIPKGAWSGSSVSTYQGSTTEQNFATLDSEDLKPSDKGGSEGQYGAVHEFGHMVGLGDEYGKDAEIAHATLVRDALGKQISRGDSDDVMSCANRVAPQHYVTFLEALKKSTGVEAWSIAE